MKKSAIHFQITLLTLAWLVCSAAITATGAEPPELAACRQAVKLKPDFAEGWFFLGRSYTQACKAAEAEAAFQKARELK